MYDVRLDESVTRRRDDTVRFWVPIILSVASLVLSFGVVYGRMGGRLDLIEYRLMLIENKLAMMSNR